jgi:hypothetical protein
MNQRTGQSYVHRSNRDGSYDSICTGCFATVASARNEAELSMRECTHVCIPDWYHQVAV